MGVEMILTIVVWCRYHGLISGLKRTDSADGSLGSLAKLRKATLSFVMSVRQPVHMEHLSCHCTDYQEIWF